MSVLVIKLGPGLIRLHNLGVTSGTVFEEPTYKNTRYPQAPPDVSRAVATAVGGCSGKSLTQVTCHPLVM